MSASVLSLLIIVSIALAVFLGYKTGINTGLFCIVFAYAIGCFVMGMSTKNLIATWPTNTMFVILAVSLFYNVAAAKPWKSCPRPCCTPAGSSPACCPTPCSSWR